MEKEILIKKIHEAIIEMMKDVSFDEEAHRYTRKSDGKWLAGISSISGLLPKEYLIPWAAKETVKFLGYDDEIRAEEIHRTIIRLDKEGYQKLLTEAKDAYRKKSEAALIDGKTGHEFLETWIKANIRKTKLPKVPDDNLKRPIEQFIKWSNENIDTWILSEARVADVQEEFAGTLDALALTKEGKLTIIDLKFASGISKNYLLQLAGYSIPFEKYNIKIDDKIIIRLPKTLKLKVYDKKTQKYTTIENNIEIARSPFSHEFDCENFRHARALYRYTNSDKIN